MPTVPPEAVRPSGRFERATFDEGGYSVTEVRTGWVHPSQNFYFPGEDAPSGKDLRHLPIHDNAVLVEYRADLPEDAREAFRGWAAFTTAAVAVPADDPDSPTLRAFLADRRMTCDGVDLKRLDAFAGQRTPGASVPHEDAG